MVAKSHNFIGSKSPKSMVANKTSELNGIMVAARKDAMRSPQYPYSISQSITANVGHEILLFRRKTVREKMETA